MNPLTQDLLFYEDMKNANRLQSRLLFLAFYFGGEEDKIRPFIRLHRNMCKRYYHLFKNYF